MNWRGIIESGALAGLKPSEVWELELWEYNVYIGFLQEQRKRDAANAILTGYYAAYYTNGGKKAKNPNELIKKLYAKKQNFEDGLRDIERLKEFEKKKSGE
ncbi:MAG: hypothetical protein LBL66_10520 [Clostridiales bacterium]|nr:hypothetical protein [Clostridiales bacterium]